MFLMMGAAAAAMLLQGQYNGQGGGQGGNQYGNQYGGGQQQLPGGSYSRSCQDARVMQGRLFATCSDRSRQMRQSSIPLNACAGYPIENIDGLLSCGTVRGQFDNGRPGPGNGPGYGNGNGPGYGGNGPGRPGGGFGRSSITVFEDSEFRGRSQTFTGEVANLAPTAFNDRITSFRVQGVWQVCTNSNYGGQCFVYDYDESNVSTNRINDQISSMRPMR